MTTIAYRDGVLAADTAIFDRGVYCGAIEKIFRAPDGSLFGVAGKLGDLTRFKDWMMAGEPDTRPEFNEEDSEALIIRLDGRVLWYGIIDFTEIVGDYHVIGSGFRVAMGAMAAGASALRAIEICCDLDDGTRRPIRQLELIQPRAVQLELV